MVVTLRTSLSAQLFPLTPASSGRCIQTLTCQSVLSVPCVLVKSDNEGCPGAVLIPGSRQRSAVVKESSNGGIISGFQQVQIFSASCHFLNSLTQFVFLCVCGTEEPSWSAFAVPMLTCTLPKKQLSVDTCLLKPVPLCLPVP